MTLSKKEARFSRKQLGWEKSMVEGKYLKYEDCLDRKDRLSDLCKYWVETSSPEKKKVSAYQRNKQKTTNQTNKKHATFSFHSPWLIIIWLWTNLSDHFIYIPNQMVRVWYIKLFVSSLVFISSELYNR